ncbi:MAG: hypothetical protein K0Q76_1266 [Panacagrimonas sp.]|jgi:hypothetical protein|nr:hypothetical protein [Panacagrimonas sp.]MCC2656158.1 hypothetical protein [Panacagrimonas sp.]
MPPIHPQLLAGLEEGLLVCLRGGLALSTLWGLWLLVAPQAARRFAAGADRWVPTAAWFNRLNRPVDTTRWFYRHHRLVGVLIGAGAGYALWRWFSAYRPGAGIALLDRHWVSAGMDWLVPACEWIFLGFNCVILAFALIVIVRPSLLKTPERIANTWIDMPAERTLDRHFDPLSKLVAGRPRLIGALVAMVCGVLYWRLVGVM